MNMVNNQKGRVERYNYDVLINEAVEHGYTTDASITSYLLEIYKSDNKNNNQYTFNEWLQQLD